jgi:hypothetical protein
MHRSVDDERDYLVATATLSAKLLYTLNSYVAPTLLVWRTRAAAQKLFKRLDDGGYSHGALCRCTVSGICGLCTEAQCKNSKFTWTYYSRDGTCLDSFMWRNAATAERWELEQ